jgi:hypothetical protein
MKKINEKEKSNDLADFTVDEMPLKDTIFLSPIEKYKIYGRFPYKMIIHILLVLVTTSQGIMTIAETTQYTRAQERLFYNFFVADSDRTIVDYSRKTYLYSVDQIRDHLRISVNNFYKIKSESLEQIEYIEGHNQLAMQFSYLDKKLIGNQGKIPREFVYKVDNTTLGPFDYANEDVKYFLNSVYAFNMNYTLKTYIPFYYGDHFECFHWKILQKYNFVHRAHFIVTLDIKRNVCVDKSTMSMWDYFINRMMWVHMIVIFLAGTSLILTWKHVYKMAKIYWRLKRVQKLTKSFIEKEKKKISEDSSADLNFDVKKDEKKEEGNEKYLFNMWPVLCLIGNVIQIFGSALSLFDTDNVMSSTEILVGFGCMLAYINVGRYLEYNKDYSTIFATIKRAMPNVLRYLIGVLPIFAGFIFFGLCLFWRSERFVDTSSTMMTLFAVLNGDSVFDVFHDLSGVSFFIGQLYCYIFCIIFIVVVMNVFISIIEEAYVSTKMKNQNHWIYSYLKIDPNYVQLKDVDENKQKRHSQTNDNNIPDIAESKASRFLEKHNKEGEKVINHIKSKNIFREAIFESSKKKNNNNKIDKVDYEKTIESHFNSVNKI